MTAQFPLSYRTMTWREVWNFRAIYKQKIPAGDIDDPVFHQQVKDWHSVALKLNVCVRERLSFSQILKETVTLQIVKRWILQWILPSTLSAIEETVHKISLYLWRERKYPHDKQWTILKAQAYFEKHRDKLLPRPQPVAVPHALWLFGPIVQPVQPVDRTIIDQQVNDYFARKLKEIAEARDPLLPSWRHATKYVDSAVSILSDGAVNMNQAGYGLGAFFSSEYEDVYGDYGFAIDHQTLENLPADYFPGRTVSSHVWVQVHSPVPINASSLAHIVVNGPNEEQYLYNQIQSQAPNVTIPCPVIYKKTEAIITRCLHEAGHVRVIPPTPFWSPHPAADVHQSYLQNKARDVIEAKNLLLVS